jgi:undecaprenyl diphosphate synthase
MDGKNNNPFHLAIIMDGNGRWAKDRKKPRSFGHKKGIEAAENIVAHSLKKKIDVLSLFAFSTENWKRPRREISFLFSSFAAYLRKNKKNFIKQGIRFNLMGRRQGISRHLLSVIDDTAAATKENKSLILNIAFNYGGRAEIIDALNLVIKACRQGLLKQKRLTDADFRQYLYSDFIPDVDLLIRTSGEKRISNFFLWRLAYSELYFTDTLWPDFNPQKLDAALEDYNKRQRRFGRA